MNQQPGTIYRALQNRVPISQSSRLIFCMFVLFVYLMFFIYLLLFYYSGSSVSSADDFLVPAGDGVYFVFLLSVCHLSN